MPYHIWEDDWEHWDTLYKAMAYFDKFYFKCTLLHPATKEKYGTIRYEHVIGWIACKEHSKIFREAIRRTVRKFPAVAAEVCADAGRVLYDDFFEGWCAGVTYQSYWSSTKRPNGA